MGYFKHGKILVAADIRNGFPRTECDKSRSGLADEAPENDNVHRNRVI